MANFLPRYIVKKQHMFLLKYATIVYGGNFMYTPQRKPLLLPKHI